MRQIHPEHPAGSGTASGADRAEEPSPITGAVALVSLALIALALRLAYLWTISGRPELAAPAPGLAEDLYLGLAQRIASGDLLLGDDVYWFSPLYAYLLGALTALFGDPAWVARGMNLLLGTGTVVLLYLAVNETPGSRKVAWVAGLIAAVYGPWVLYDTSAMKTTLGVFLLTLALWLIQRARHQTTTGPWLLAGIALGGVLNLSEGLGLLPLLLLLWLVTIGPGMDQAARMPPRGRGIRAGALLLGMLLAILPFTVRNLAVTGEPLPISAKAGIHLYIGNNPSAWGGYYSIPGVRPNSAGHWFDARRVAERALGHPATAGEVSGYWTGRAFEHIRSDPGHFLSLVRTKLLLALSADEIAQTYHWGYERSRSKLLASLPGAATVLTLGLAGLILALPRARALAPWLLLLAATLAGLVLTLVNARYRTPLILGLIPFAALFLVRLWEWIRARRWSRLLAALLLASAAAALALPHRVEREIRAHQLGSAERHSQTSRELAALLRQRDAPGINPAQRRQIDLRLIAIHRSVLDWEGAARMLKRLLARHPDDIRLWRQLARLARMSGDRATASQAAQALERLDPAGRQPHRHPPAHAAEGSR